MSTVRFDARNAGLAALAGLGVLLVAVSVRASPVHASFTGHTSQPTAAPTQALPPPPNASLGRDRQQGVPHWLIMLVHVLILAAEVTALLLIIAGLIWLARRRFTLPAEWRRRQRRPAAPVEATPALPDLRRQVSATIDEAWLRSSDGHTRDAVLQCWLRLQEIAATAGVPARASDTSTELARRLLAQLAVNRESLAELAALYREARFSAHAMSSVSTERARAALRVLRADLAEPTARPHA